MDGKKIDFVILDEVAGPKHARVAFPALLDGWCDAGEHEIKEGELILRSSEHRGFVHLNCL